MTIKSRLDRAIVKVPRLEPGEVLIFEAPANRTVSGSRNAGGMLFITTTRVCFAPNFVERWLRAGAWELPKSRIRGVRTVGRDIRRPFAGGLTHRLEIEFDDGVRELFVIRDHEAAAVALRQ